MNNKNIEYECSPNVKASGFTELMHAVMRKDEEYVENFVNSNSEGINDQNSQGWTALMLASRNSRTDSSENIVKLLLMHRLVEVNLQNNNGSTSLMLACECSNEESSEETLDSC